MFSKEAPKVDQLLLRYLFRNNRDKLPTTKRFKKVPIFKELYPDASNFYHLQVLYPKLKYSILWPLLITLSYYYLFLLGVDEFNFENANEILKFLGAIVAGASISIFSSLLLFVGVKYGITYRKFGFDFCNISAISSKLHWILKLLMLLTISLLGCIAIALIRFRCI